MSGSALVVGLQDGSDDDQELIFDVLALSRTLAREQTLQNSAAEEIGNSRNERAPDFIGA